MPAVSEGAAPIFLCLLFFTLRDLTTVQSAPTLRTARTVWKNVQMAYRGQTVSYSSMPTRIGSATRAIPTARKGKHPCREGLGLECGGVANPKGHSRAFFPDTAFNVYSVLTQNSVRLYIHYVDFKQDPF